MFDIGRVIIESLPSLDVTRLKAGGEAAVWTAPIHGSQRAVLDQACAYGSMCVCECDVRCYVWVHAGEHPYIPSGTII